MIRRILALAWLNVLQLLRNPAEVMGVIGLPLVLTLLFGTAFAGQGESALRVLVVDEDESAYSRQALGLIDAEESLETSAVSRLEAERLIAEGSVSVAVLVAEGFGEDLTSGEATIEVLRDPASESALAVASIAQGVALRMSGDAETARVALALLPPGTASFDDLYWQADAEWEPEPPLSAVGEVVVASDVRGDSVLPNGSTLSSIGFTVWFILFVTFGGAGGILEERELGTLRRLLVTPAGKGTIIAGKIAGVVAMAVVQAIILVVLGALLFGVPWGNDPLAVVLVLGAYILAGTGLAILVSALVRTRDQLSGAGPLLSTGLAMLGGCLWPIEILPPFMKAVAMATPTGWAVMGLTDIVARNQGLASAVLPVAVLLGFAAVSLGLGVRLLKFE